MLGSLYLYDTWNKETTMALKFTGIKNDRFARKIYRGTQSALKHLVEASLASQSADYLRRFRNSASHFLDEFCTIKFAGSRQIGHTTAIFEASKLFEKPLFIFNNMAMAESFCHQFGIKASRTRSYGAGTLETNMRGIVADAVFVDLASRMPKEAEEVIKSMCLAYLPSNDQFCLVLVH
jgi:hypothetical protein